MQCYNLGSGHYRRLRTVAAKANALCLCMVWLKAAAYLSSNDSMHLWTYCVTYSHWIRSVLPEHQGSVGEPLCFKVGFQTSEERADLIPSDIILSSSTSLWASQLPSCLFGHFSAFNIWTLGRKVMSCYPYEVGFCFVLNFKRQTAVLSRNKGLGRFAQSDTPTAGHYPGLWLSAQECKGRSGSRGSRTLCSADR